MEDFFGALIGIVLLIIGVVWFIQAYPGVVFALFLSVAGFFVIRFAIRENKAEKARRELEAAQRLENERRRAAEQLAYERQILAACNESVTAFENIPKDLMTAEELLTVAEDEFKDGVFSPFWDSIEKATCKLGAVDGNIKLIVDRSGHYKSLAESYLGKPPPFPVDPMSAHRLGTVKDTAGRLQRIVRNAQRNFQFATIYEQRKTNSILMAGFSSLGEAIYGVGERLQESIGALSDQISDLSSSVAEHNERLIEAIHVHSEKLVESIQDVSVAVGKTSSQVGEVSSAIKGADAKAQVATADLAARQERANRMLDNIQRHRTPPPFADH
jgi:Mg2+ and Co2+ transporter CorA